MPVKRVQKTPMPERDAVLRSHDFEEVNEGYWYRACAIRGGAVPALPGPDLYRRLSGARTDSRFHPRSCAGDMSAAAEVLRSSNPLPAVCGRVCPQEVQCEEQCSVGIRFKPVAIGYLERFVADWEMRSQR